MATKCNPIIHQSISKASRQIRLLRILSDTSTEDIECSLDVYEIDTAPSYTAISYTWGPIAPECQIIINGAKTTVRENCRSALRLARFHRASLPAHLWIDAICIDQQNLTEKSHQVQMMADIYAKADPVFVSLGSDYPSIRPDFIEKSLSNRHWTELEVECRNLLQVSKASYWSRLWIVQEYLLARENGLYIAAGTGIFDGIKLHNLLKAIDRARRRINVRFNPNLRDLQRCWKEIIESDMALLSLQKDEQEYFSTLASDMGSLSDLWKTYGHYACADIRDKVFGLLNLVQCSRLNVFMQADYTKSTLAVALDCLRCGVSPLLARAVLGLDCSEPDIRKGISSLNQMKLQGGALTQMNGLVEDFPELTLCPLCDHRCATRYSAVMDPRTYPTDRDGTRYQTHFPLEFLVRWCSNNDTGSARLSYKTFRARELSQLDERGLDRTLLVSFVPNVNLDTLNIATIWVPWMYYGIHALVPTLHDIRGRVSEHSGPCTFNLVCRSELETRVTLAGLESLVEPNERQNPFSFVPSETSARNLEAAWAQVPSSHILDFHGLVLRGADHSLYLIIGPSTTKPNHVVQCNPWLDDPLFRNERSRFYHIVQARDFYRKEVPHRDGFDIPIYMDPQDVMIATCQDHEQQRTEEDRLLHAKIMCS